MDVKLLRAEGVYVGCPHCGGPVHVGEALERARHDLLTALLFLLARQPPLARLRRKVEAMRVEAEERLYADHLAPKEG